MVGGEGAGQLRREGGVAAADGGGAATGQGGAAAADGGGPATGQRGGPTRQEQLPSRSEATFRYLGSSRMLTGT